MDFYALAAECASAMPAHILSAIVRVESSYNPYAIGVVKGRLSRQPKTHAEAIATAQMLHREGYNFSMGLGQINKINLSRFNLDYSSVFDVCKNLHASSKILQECYIKATKKGQKDDNALLSAFSCYYSGNLSRGFIPDVKGQPSYVQKVAAHTHINSTAVAPIRIIPNHSKVGALPAERKESITEPNKEVHTKSKQAWDVFNDF